MIMVSHVISRCTNCNALTKVRIQQFCSSFIDSYLAATANEESEVVILCNDCREKQLKHG